MKICAILNILLIVIIKPFCLQAVTCFKIECLNVVLGTFRDKCRVCFRIFVSLLIELALWEINDLSLVAPIVKSKYRASIFGLKIYVTILLIFFSLIANSLSSSTKSKLKTFLNFSIVVTKVGTV